MLTLALAAEAAVPNPCDAPLLLQIVREVLAQIVPLVSVALTGLVTWIVYLVRQRMNAGTALDKLSQLQMAAQMGASAAEEESEANRKLTGQPDTSKEKRANATNGVLTLTQETDPAKISIAIHAAVADAPGLGATGGGPVVPTIPQR